MACCTTGTTTLDRVQGSYGKKERLNITETTQYQAQRNWNPPNSGLLLINTDATIFSHKARLGIGVIARDWQGNVIKVWAKGEQKNSLPLEEEALEVRWALLKAHEAG